MSGRREFLKAGAALSLLGGAAGAQQRDAFGPGPPVADRLDQGPFGIEQDEGWYTIEATTASSEPVRNFGLGLVGYTWGGNGPALAGRAGAEGGRDRSASSRATITPSSSARSATSTTCWPRRSTRIRWWSSRT